MVKMTSSVFKASNLGPKPNGGLISVQLLLEAILFFLSNWEVNSLQDCLRNTESMENMNSSVVKASDLGPKYLMVGFL